MKLQSKLDSNFYLYRISIHIVRKGWDELGKGKVGLALGGGAARGMAHIGVLEVLQREGIPIDMIAGTSAGALVGALCGQKKDCSMMKDLATSIGLKSMISLVDLVMPRTGLIGGRKIASLLGTILGGDIEFDELEIPLACVATDIITGEEVVIREGSVLEAIRASISIPGIFSIVKWGKRYLVDGALVDPVPVRVVKKMGADLVIAVNVLPGIGEKSGNRVKKGRQSVREPNLFTVILQSMQISADALVKSSLEGADIVIHPQVAHISAGDLRQAQECILQGELAAEASIPEMKKLLEAC